MSGGGGEGEGRVGGREMMGGRRKREENIQKAILTHQSYLTPQGWHVLP